jgi:hypothetical protein
MMKKQERKTSNDQKRPTARTAGDGYDKKLDGPNRPSI